MTEKERDAIKRLTDISRPLRDASKDPEIKARFLQELCIKNIYIKRFVLENLNDSYNRKSVEDIGSSLFVGFAFDVYSSDFADILCKLLSADWHYCHEDVASILQKIKQPSSVNSLYHAALSNFKYLDYSDASPLAVKCIWALGGIKTEEAREKLKLLAQSENAIIKENAVKQLERQ